jgi:hypothetical protein
MNIPVKEMQTDWQRLDHVSPLFVFRLVYVHQVFNANFQAQMLAEYVVFDMLFAIRTEAAKLALSALK